MEKVNMYKQMIEEKKMEVFKPDLIEMKSRMGKATSSHFHALNPAIQKHKTEANAFDPDKLLNPTLRTKSKANLNLDLEMIKVKQMF
jgi:hypothetical protein